MSHPITPNDESTATDGAGTAAVTPTGIRRPAPSTLDTIETAALDEFQHEAALRNSALRVPR
jgi:hypothetical protein